MYLTPTEKRRLIVANLLRTHGTISYYRQRWLAKKLGVSWSTLRVDIKVLADAVSTPSHAPTYYVYVLIDPRTEAVRYVGATKDLELRERAHRATNKYMGRRYLAWMAELRAANCHPRMVVVATAATPQAVGELEQQTVRTYRVQGVDLVNGIDKTHYFQGLDRSFLYRTS